MGLSISDKYTLFCFFENIKELHDCDIDILNLISNNILKKEVFSEEIDSRTSIKNVIFDSNLSVEKVFNFVQEIASVVVRQCENGLMEQSDLNHLIDMDSLMGNYKFDNPIFEDFNAHEIMQKDMITKIIQKMLVDSENYPEDSIGKAKELMEAVMKTILDKRDVNYKRKVNMPTLFKKVYQTLNLNPDTSSDSKLSDITKQILDGFKDSTEGLKDLRNNFGSGHGKSEEEIIKITPRYAHLAINSVYTIIIFLIETYDYVSNPDDNKENVLPF
ncbi:abortive infection family protein [Holzapfeliella sp. JNUCC 80]